MTLELDRVPGGAPVFLLAAPWTRTTPLPGGCSLFVAPDAIAIPWAAVGPAVPGAGTARATLTVPVLLPADGVTAAFQAIALDAGAGLGFAASNGAAWWLR